MLALKSVDPLLSSSIGIISVDCPIDVDALIDTITVANAGKLHIVH